MNLENKTILITGGASGLGLEAIGHFLAEGCRVLICGRTPRTLDLARQRHPNITTIECDITQEDDVTRLVQEVERLGGIDVLYNNAAVIFLYNLATDGKRAFEAAQAEMNTNFLAIVRLNSLLLPLLARRPEAAIINTSSAVAYLPAAVIPTYSASKAALHSYTTSLRHQLKEAGSQVKIFELLPPAVDTEAVRELKADKISTTAVIKALLNALKRDQYVVNVGPAKILYALTRLLPSAAFAVLNPRNSASQR